MGVNCEEIISERKYMNWSLINSVFNSFMLFCIVKKLLMPKKKEVVLQEH